jgi:transcriptional regulator with XRE-family HTH domain
MDKETLKQKFFESGFSREELAVKIGCSFSTVCNLLRGKRVSERVEFMAMRVLGMTKEKQLPYRVSV